MNKEQQAQYYQNRILAGIDAIESKGIERLVPHEYHWYSEVLPGLYDEAMDIQDLRMRSSCLMFLSARLNKLRDDIEARKNHED